MTPMGIDEFTDEAYEAFGSLLGAPGHKVPRAGSGHRYDPMNFAVIRILCRHPDLARTFMAFNNRQLFSSTLTTRQIELAVLRVAHRRQSPYEWNEHVKKANEAGISDAEIDALVSGNEGFTGLDLLVLEATDQLLTHHQVDDAMWARLAAAFDNQQVLELLFLVGTYSMLAMVFESCGLLPPEGANALPPVPAGE
jgi:alkylhydroperoxidase family enzyme